MTPNPIRLKRRVLRNPLMNAIRMGFVLGLIAYLAVRGGRIGAGGWALLTEMTLATMGRIGFWVTVMDTDEDRAEGIRTPVRRLRTEAGHSHRDHAGGCGSGNVRIRPGDPARAVGPARGDRRRGRSGLSGQPAPPRHERPARDLLAAKPGGYPP
jgi:hypothetical protein